MKKTLTITILAIVLVMAFAVPAFAVKPLDQVKAQNIPWYQCGGNSDVYGPGVVPGNVMLNTPSGAVTMILDGEITLAPSTTYTVWVRQFTGYTGDFFNSYSPLGYFSLGQFTTDEAGVGSFHYNIRDEYLPAAVRNIQVAVNAGTEAAPSTGYGSTVACTAMYTVVENH